MRRTLLFSLLFVSYSFSSDIILSKDSVKTNNNLSSSKSDHVIIKNNSDDSIAVDSAYILFDVFDTSGISQYLSIAGKFEVHWIEGINKSDFLWDLNEIEKNKYKLVKNYFYPNSAIPLRCPPKDSCDLGGLQIGIYLVSAHFPLYPKYLSGTLQLFLTNNQNINIRLYSDDLRTDALSKIDKGRKNQINYSYSYISLNGKKIKNFNANTKYICVVKSDQKRCLANKTISLDRQALPFIR